MSPSDFEAVRDAAPTDLQCPPQVWKPGIRETLASRWGQLCPAARLSIVWLFGMPAERRRIAPTFELLHNLGGTMRDFVDTISDPVAKAVCLHRLKMRNRHHPK
jgi:hypothetical protein